MENKTIPIPIVLAVLGGLLLILQPQLPWVERVLPSVVVTSPASALIVRESSTNTPEFAGLEVRLRKATLPIPLTIHDADDQAIANYAPFAPRELILLDDSGSVISRRDCPATLEAITEALR